MAEKEESKTQGNLEEKIEDTHHFAIQRLYAKDLSFEAPHTPDIFNQEWQPDLHLDIHTGFTRIQEDTYEAMLTLTVTVKNKEINAFLIEVKYAGIFNIKGFTDQQLHQTLGSFCPGVLYPYAREVVTALASRGGFPQLVLAPVNFDALYAQHQAEQAKQAQKAEKPGEEEEGGIAAS